MSRSWRVAMVSVLAMFGIAVTVWVVARNGVDSETLVVIVTGLVYLAVSGLLVIRVPRNRVSWGVLVASIGLILAGLGTVLPTTGRICSSGRSCSS